MGKLACLCVGLLAGILLASFARASQVGGTSLDPAKLDPEMYKVVLENDHVRVIDYRLKPGQKEPMHSHPNGVFVYYFTEANTRGSVLNGETTETHRKAGDVLWRDPVTHVAQNVGNAEIHQLLVEPKEYCGKSTDGR